MRVLTWLSRHDPAYSALRRAGRAAIVMPLLFAFGGGVIRNSDVAVFAAFGSFAMLLLVDFSGPLIERVQAQAALAVAGAVFVCLGTLSSRPVWLSAVVMAVVALAVLFAGSVSSVMASASTSLLLAFILPVTLPADPGSIPPRLLGWGIASVVGIVAIVVLWPAPPREPLRGPAVDACRALATRLRAESAYLHGGADPALSAERDRTRAQADAALAKLHHAFLATPYRPTGLSTSARTIVRLVDELAWLSAVLAQFDRYGQSSAASPGPIHAAAWDVKNAAASALEEGAALLSVHAGDPSGLEARLRSLAEARAAVETATTGAPAATGGAGGAADGSMRDMMIGLDPGFRAQELAYAVATVGGNIALTARAERRTWWQRLTGRQPGELAGPVAAAAERASGYVGWNSVWLRNSIRGAIALGVAVLLANLTGVQHSFWVVLGTLSVLRSNALSTGQTALRGVVGTAVGVVVGALALLVIGDNPVALWIVLPVAILAAGIAPAAISFAAGQAAFTILLVLLFNIIAPTGWTVGLVRIEDIALGCAVSLGVGVLFWPRGASASLRRALADAYSGGVDYLAATVAFGVGGARADAARSGSPAEAPAAAGSGSPVEARAAAGSGSLPEAPAEPRSEALRAAAASRRLDDAFRTYLAERGAKARPLAEVAASVTGVAGMRLASDAVLELWRARQISDAPAVERVLHESVGRLEAWYRGLAEQLVTRGPLPHPLPADPGLDERLADALRDDFGDRPGDSGRAIVEIIWTADYLEVVRRLQESIAAPADALSTEAGGGR